MYTHSTCMVISHVYVPTMNEFIGFEDFCDFRDAIDDSAGEVASVHELVNQDFPRRLKRSSISIPINKFQNDVRVEKLSRVSGRYIYIYRERDNEIKSLNF